VTWCSVTVDKLMLDCKTGAIARCAVSPAPNRTVRTAFMRGARFGGTSNGQTRTRIGRKGRDPNVANRDLPRKNPYLQGKNGLSAVTNRV
jgi:hypothetical protein